MNLIFSKIEQKTNTCPIDRKVFKSIKATDSNRVINVENRQQTNPLEAFEDVTYCEVCGRFDREILVNSYRLSEWVRDFDTEHEEEYDDDEISENETLKLEHQSTKDDSISSAIDRALNTTIVPLTKFNNLTRRNIAEISKPGQATCGSLCTVQLRNKMQILLFRIQNRQCQTTQLSFVMVQLYKRVARK